MSARDTFETLVDHGRGFGPEIPVVPSEALAPGSMVLIAGAVHAHPLDVIALRCGDDVDRRLREAIAWIVARAMRQFDALIAALDEEIEQPETGS